MHEHWKNREKTKKKQTARKQRGRTDRQTTPVTWRARGEVVEEKLGGIVRVWARYLLEVCACLHLADGRHDGVPHQHAYVCPGKPCNTQHHTRSMTELFTKQDTNTVPTNMPMPAPENRMQQRTDTTHGLIISARKNTDTTVQTQYNTVHTNTHARTALTFRSVP